MNDSARMPSEARISAIDAFRGFALAGIVLAHMVEQYIAAMPPPDLAAKFANGMIDQVVQGAMYALVMGKFFALFSFLFGLSFFIQMHRAASRNVDFRARFLWRITLLLAIGYIHSLFYRGDILTIYAPLAFLLVLFYEVRSTWLLAVSAILLAGAGRYIVFSVFGDSTFVPYGDMDPSTPQNIAYFDAMLNGSMTDVFASNAVHGHLAKMQFQLGIFGRWYLTFAFFLLGLWAGRVQLFTRLDEFHGAIKKALWIALASMVVFLVLGIQLFGAVMIEGEGPDFERWLSMFALTAFDLFNFSLAIVYLCCFILIFKRPAGGRFLNRLAPYGRTALSSYFMQTIIGTFILYHWGLGLLGELTNSQTLLIAIAIIALQIYLSTQWLKHFRYGPLEWLWRSGTYLKWQPLRRN